MILTSGPRWFFVHPIFIKSHGAPYSITGIAIVSGEGKNPSVFGCSLNDRRLIRIFVLYSKIINVLFLFLSSYLCETLLVAQEEKEEGEASLLLSSDSRWFMMFTTTVFKKRRNNIAFALRVHVII